MIFHHFQALDEAENEFETSHEKVIKTDPKGGVRTAVPKGFPCAQKMMNLFISFRFDVVL